MTILTFHKKKEKEVKIKFQYHASYHDNKFIHGSKEITEKQLRDIQRVLRNELFEIAKENGAEVLHDPYDMAKPDLIAFTEQQLRTTVEQVCAPLVAALETCTSEGFCDYDECDNALVNYRTLIGDKE